MEENLSDFLFWFEMAENKKVAAAFAAQGELEQKLKQMAPLRDFSAPEPEIEARAGFSLLAGPKKEKVLFAKNPDTKLAIASLTKLMTAYVVLENYDLSQIIKISKESVLQEAEFGKLKIGEIFKAGDLLYPLLMESSNDAGFALSFDYEGMSQQAFFDLMNLEAENFGLKNTFFVNSTGLDPKNPEDTPNYSTAKELAYLTDFLIQKQPLIWEILGKKEFSLFAADNVFHHKMKNNNQLLEKTDNWGPYVLAGKTGWTERAQGCLILAVKAPKNQGYLINVILGAEDRFGEMEKLVDWVFLAYKW